MQFRMSSKFLFILVLFAIFIFCNMMCYRMGKDDGEEIGRTEYAMLVGTVASRLPYECKKRFEESLWEQVRIERGKN